MVGFVYVGVLECRTYSLPHIEARKSLIFSFSLQQNKLKYTDKDKKNLKPYFLESIAGYFATNHI